MKPWLQLETFNHLPLALQGLIPYFRPCYIHSFFQTKPHLPITIAKVAQKWFLRLPLLTSPFSKCSSMQFLSTFYTSTSRPTLHSKILIYPDANHLHRIHLKWWKLRWLVPLKLLKSKIRKNTLKSVISTTSLLIILRGLLILGKST